MYTSSLFRYFPPPKFLAMKHAGLDISDDAVRLIEYTLGKHGLHIEKFGRKELPPGVIEGGDIRNENELVRFLADFGATNKLLHVKVSVPEEKAYLFQTEVSSSDTNTARQNIEFKLEENVPLSAAEAQFSFDILPIAVAGNNLRASVSVVPQSYIDVYINILNRAGMVPVAFEVAPKSIARSIVKRGENTTCLILHMMKGKTGIYIVSDEVMCFTSTISSTNFGDSGKEKSDHLVNLTKEVNRVYQYWMSHGGTAPSVDAILLVGRNADDFEADLQHGLSELSIPVMTADVWKNVFDLEKYVPPISKQDSPEYAVAAGLAMITDV